MKVAVTDTNVFIDLFRADLLTPLLQSGMAVHTTSEAINELRYNQQMILQELVQERKITVNRFSAMDLATISQLPLAPGLSFVDRGIFYYARNLRNCLLLSNNPILHSVCNSCQIETSSTVGLLGLLKRKELFPNSIVCKALSLIRLPPATSKHSIQERRELSQLCECEILSFPEIIISA